MARYLVTGGAGFIGSHLCESLLARSHSVRILDNLSTGFRSNIPVGADFVWGDVADLDFVRQCMQGMDGCFHFAGSSTADWLRDHRTNLTGLVTVFEAIRRAKRRIPVVYASSATVYGHAITIPIEEGRVCLPISNEGADSRACELHARAATLAHRIPAVGLRLFNIYGPRQNRGVIATFCKQLLEESAINIFGDGRQTRDFVYVSDATRACLAAMCIARNRLRPLVINVCTGLPTAIRILPTMLSKLIDCDPKVNYLPARQLEIRHSIGDPTRMIKQFGFMPPRTLLTDGLADVVNWMRDGASLAGRKLQR